MPRRLTLHILTAHPFHIIILHFICNDAMRSSCIAHRPINTCSLDTSRLICLQVVPDGAYSGLVNGGLIRRKPRRPHSRRPLLLHIVRQFPRRISKSESFDASLMSQRLRSLAIGSNGVRRRECSRNGVDVAKVANGIDKLVDEGKCVGSDRHTVIKPVANVIASSIEHCLRLSVHRLRSRWDQI